MSSAGKRLGRAVRSSLVAVGAGTVVGGGWLYYRLQQFAAGPTTLPTKFVLDWDVDCPVTEKSNGRWRALAQRDSLTLSQVVAALQHAATDERCAGLMASLGANQGFTGLAQVQELRAAVLDFRKKTAGRVPAVAFATSFGEFTMNGTASYYLASAFDKVYLQPSGLLALTGVAASTAFLRPLLDKWKIKPIFKAKEEYKNVANQFTQTDYTPQHREATTAMLQGVLGQMAKGVAASRKLTLPEVWKAVNDAPFLAEEALQRGLVDGILYKDEVEAETPDMERVSLSDYVRAVNKAQEAEKRWQRAKASWDKRELPAVGLIMAQGNIVSGKGSTSGFGEIPQIASARLAAALTRAREDERCKAVVLRLDTPGGSAVASDSLYREVLRTAVQKPLVVSMGNVAASGGYYIAAPATKILAQPGSLTGSIGVVFGKFNIQAFLRELGVQPSTIKVGSNSDAMLPFSDFSGQQEEQIERIVDNIYSGFISKVAQGRGMDMAAVKAIAKGRVWTGEDAHARGLVDQLGGLQDALQVAKQLAGLPIGEGSCYVEVVDYSQSGDKLKDLLAKLQGASPGLASLARLGIVLESAFPAGLPLQGLLESLCEPSDFGLYAGNSGLDWS